MLTKSGLYLLNVSNIDSFAKVVNKPKYDIEFGIQFKDVIKFLIFKDYFSRTWFNKFLNCFKYTKEKLRRKR
jgi:hypothetical protein